jgi:hypothetical protein
VRRGRLRSPPVRSDAGRIPLRPAIHVQEPGPSVPRSVQGKLFLCFFSCVCRYVGIYVHTMQISIIKSPFLTLPTYIHSYTIYRINENKIC